VPAVQSNEVYPTPPAPVRLASFGGASDKRFPLGDKEFDKVAGRLLEAIAGVWGLESRAAMKVLLEAVREKGGRSLLKPIATLIEQDVVLRRLQELLPLAEEARAAVSARR
jgi:hypothetical protein